MKRSKTRTPHPRTVIDPEAVAENARQIPLRYPFNALASYHYYRKADLRTLTNGGLRLIGDSGAFSALASGAAIDLVEFSEWAKLWHDQLCWVAALDVIGDAEGTWRNYKRMRHQLGVDCIPTLHAGDDKTLIDRYAAEGVDFMGLGGLVPHRGRPKATLPWLADVMRYARDKHPGMRFHGWGVTNPNLIKALPWYSVDSSTIGEGYMYGRLTLFDPASGTWTKIVLDGKDAWRHDDFLRRYYCVRAKQVLISTPMTRATLVRITGRSYQFVETYLRKRHGEITAPTYGVHEPTPPRGPSVHAAPATCGSISDARPLFDPDAGPPAGPSVHAAVSSTGGNTSPEAWVQALGQPGSGPAVHATVSTLTPEVWVGALGRPTPGPSVHASLPTNRRPDDVLAEIGRPPAAKGCTP